MKRFSLSWRYLLVGLLFASGFVAVTLSGSHAKAGSVAKAAPASVLLSYLPPPTPTPSPKIVYSKAYTANQKWSVFIANPDGSGENPLTTGDDDTQPAFSADGLKVAFARKISDNYDIYVVASSGGVPQKVTNHNDDEMEPAWSPVGDKLAFVRGKDSTFLNNPCDEGGCSQDADIYVREANGREVRLTNTGHNTDPTWSPNGAWIAFSRRVNPTSKADIYKVNLITGALVQLTATPDLNEGESAWSPNSGNPLLAYTTSYDVDVMNLAHALLPPGKMPTGNYAPTLQRVTPEIKLLNPISGSPVGNTIINACEPAWATNGQQITYTYIIDDNSTCASLDACKDWPALGLLSVSGTTMTPLTPPQRKGRGFWSPSRVGN